MSRAPHSARYSRHRLIVASAIACCLLISGYWLHAYLTSPVRIANLTAAALIRSDARGLLALASQKERRALHLTPQTVEAGLREVGWSAAAPRMRVDVLNARPYYGDVLQYAVAFSGGTPDGKQRRAEIYVYRDESGKWRVGLSMLLFALPEICQNVGSNHSELWDAMARRSGIVGCTIPAGPTRYAADGSHSFGIRLTVPDS